LVALVLNDLRLGYESNDPADLEFGCNVWSRTHQDSDGFIGGVVIAVDEEAETVEVLPNFRPSLGPSPRTIPYNEIAWDIFEQDTHTFAKGGAAAAVDQLTKWLARLTTTRDRQRANATRWHDVLGRLMAVADGPGYTPRAEVRYRRFQAEKHARWDAEAEERKATQP
jgi:hypothetical protein